MTDEEFETFIRWWLGDLTEDEMSSTNIQLIIAMINEQYPDATDCFLKYQYIRAVLLWLIREDSKGGTSGDVTKRKEHRGSTKIEVEYSDDGTSSSWESILDDLEADPSSIGCTPFEDSCSVFRFGGANTNPYEAPYKSQRKKEDAARRNTPADRYKPRGMFRF